jgi:GMP synthase (glutamine-hydrolysing)
MRLHLLEHDPDELSDTHLIQWAKQKGHAVGQTYLCKNEKPPALDEIDWLMVMGGSPSVWEEDKYPWLIPEKELIARALVHNKIILGICFGAQLLAQALGGTVSANCPKEIGWHDVNLTKAGRRSFLFRGIPDRFTTFHWHSNCFTVPQGCTRLAFSEATPNQAFVSETRSIVGLQFHPEYTPAMVTYFSREYGHTWESGPFVPSPQVVVNKTGHLQETYKLMATLLDNMEQEFTAPG